MATISSTLALEDRMSPTLHNTANALVKATAEMDTMAVKMDALDDKSASNKAELQTLENQLNNMQNSWKAGSPEVEALEKKVVNLRLATIRATEAADKYREGTYGKQIAEVERLEQKLLEQRRLYESGGNAAIEAGEKSAEGLELSSASARALNAGLMGIGSKFGQIGQVGVRTMRQIILGLKSGEISAIAFNAALTLGISLLIVAGTKAYEYFAKKAAQTKKIIDDITNSIQNLVSKNVNSFINGIDKWESYYNKAYEKAKKMNMEISKTPIDKINKLNDYLDKTQSSLYKAQLSLKGAFSAAALKSLEQYGITLKTINDVIRVGISWIEQNIEKIVTGLTILAIGAAAFFAMWAIGWAVANWQMIMLAMGVYALATNVVGVGDETETTQEKIQRMIKTALIGFGNFYNIVVRVINKFIEAENQTGALQEGVIDFAIQAVKSFRKVLDAGNWIIDVLNAIIGALTLGLGPAVNSIIDLYNRIKGTNIGHILEIPKKNVDLIQATDEALAELEAAKAGITKGAAIPLIPEIEDVEGWADNLSGVVGGFAGNLIKEGQNLTKYFDSLSILDGMNFDSSGALKTANQNDISLKDEDIQMLVDIATRKYGDIEYQQITPQIVLNDMVVQESADVNQIFNILAERIEEITNGSVVMA